MARRLVDLGTLKTYLGIPLTTCTFDLALAEILDRVKPVVEEHLGEPVLETTRDYFFSGEGCPELNLPFRAVRGIESVTKLGGVGESDSVLDAGSYRLQRYSGGYRLLHAERWECSEYMAQFELGRTTVPGPIQEATLRIATEVVAKSRIAGLGDARLGVRVHGEVVPDTEPASDGTYAIAEVTPASITPEIEALLAGFKIITIPF